MGHYHTFDIPQRGPTFRRKGREYFVTQDETDGDGKRVRPESGVSIGGGCPWGIVRFYDVTDGSNPRKAGEFKLEVNEHLNCPRTQKDGSLTPGGRAVANFYSPHYGGIPTTDDPNVAIFSWNASGLRVVDIRDLQSPREIAYYNPPPNPTTNERCNTWACTNEFVDAVESRVRYRPDTGHIWFASVSNGFHIATLTGGASDIPK